MEAATATAIPADDAGDSVGEEDSVHSDSDIQSEDDEDAVQGEPVPEDSAPSDYNTYFCGSDFLSFPENAPFVEPQPDHIDSDVDTDTEVVD